MKMRVVTKEDGTVIGSQRITRLEHGRANAPYAAVRALAGQKMHEIDVPDELAAVEDGAELHKRLQAHLARR